MYILNLFLKYKKLIFIIHRLLEKKIQIKKCLQPTEITIKARIQHRPKAYSLS